MSWIAGKYNEKISIAGFLAYPITLYNFLASTDDAIREGFNNICGTHFTRGEKWRSYKKDHFKNGHKNGFFNNLRYRVSNARNAVKRLGAKPELWYLAQEASYFAAIVPLQVEAGFYIDEKGGSVFTSIGLNAAVGSLLSWIRRGIIFWYVDRELTRFLTPTPEMCAAAKDFDAVPLPAPRSFRWFKKMPLPAPQTVATSAVTAISIWAILESMLASASAAFGLFVPPGVEESAVGDFNNDRNFL